MKPGLTPASAWEPIRESDWTAAAARHFFRRAAWSATPEEVAKALSDGPLETVEKAFTLSRMPMPPAVAEAAGGQPERFRLAREAPTPEKRAELLREAQQRARATFQEMTIDWLGFARNPRNAAYEKWVSFLQNIFVVSYARFNNPNWLFRHHDLLRREGLGTAPSLCSAVSKSAAMILYLDLQQSSRSAPNENFARELFELFTLGEGNYTENDIREAARAFTGYRHRNGDFLFSKGQHDDGKKTIFGRTGNWNGDDVIRLIFEQKAAATFIPREMCRFYLSDRDLNPAYLDELGKIWQKSGFDFPTLLKRFFTSRIFHDRRFRGNMIKSPTQFHLGLLHDLNLTVPPFPRSVLVRYRQMGQDLYHPPNVRGWVGGQLWINASTLSARRMLVESLFQPLKPDQLNADELRALEKAKAAGPVNLVISKERLQQLAGADPATVAKRFTQFFLANPVSPAFRKTLTDHLSETGGNRPERIRSAAMAILQSPEYNLC